jgi:PAS domain S-box-containing protein
LRQRIVDNHLTLSVEDTGCGIPSSELGNVFKRFYRVEGTEGRTYEGTGIGLSLVQELVNLHGGTISAESMEGQGSTFTVSIPTGKDHLPADHIGGDRPLVPAGIRVDAFVEEALGWAPGLSKETIGEDGKANSARGDHSRLRILLADDNADMRDYVSKLLLAAYDVEKVTDGEEAWNAICARRPDLLLTDVMMPNLDGFGLLARIRGSAETRSLPVILLSARAGEESRLGGLEAGADDYLIKPFSARELAARVRSNLEVAKLRQESVRVEERLKAEERLSVTLQSIGDAVISTDHIGRIEFMNEVAQVLTGWRLTEAKGQNLNNIFNIVQEVTRIKPENPVAKVIRSGNVVGLANHTVLIRRDGSEIPIDDSAAPIRNKDGAIEGVVLVFHDISARRKSEKALRDNDRLATTGRLAASIAHEINNPLSAVGNLLYLVAQEAEEDSIVRQYVAMASQELGRVSQITQQMLTFQREAAKPTPVRISDVVENVLALFERKIVSAGIQIEKRIEFDGQILALPGELRQAVANLTGNAIEALAAFTNGKTGKLMIHLYSSREWRNGMAGLRVVVADNGPGISGDIRERIFEPFFTTKGESGTGLGLWITADIISKYGGTLRLRSSTQPHLSGSCFSVFFPLDGK